MAGTHPVPAGSLHDVPLCDGGLPAADRRLPRAQRGGSDRSLLRVGLPGSNAGRSLLMMSENTQTQVRKPQLLND